MKSFLTLADLWINTSWSCCGNKTLLLFYARKIPCTCAALWNNQRQKLSPCAQLFSQFHHILLSWRKFQGWTLLNDHFVVCWVLENHISVISLYFIATSLRVNTICSLLTKIRQKCNLDKSPSFQKYFSLWGNYGPDRLESTILKITGKIPVVIYTRFCHTIADFALWWTRSSLNHTEWKSQIVAKYTYSIWNYTSAQLALPEDPGRASWVEV